ncbi:MAG: hypothetical protein M1453_03235 [Acidobacteria bacterium]|nr:hypothetical protein [Acidobacteriota bacterium]MCL5286993.1 hypothetical protein [Acidobacteriota bacterium]
MYDPHAHKIHIDGSALKNPGGPGGLAGMIEFPEALNRECEVVFEEGYKATTNNRMELLACIRALEYLCAEAKTLGVTRALIITDSLYLQQYCNNARLWRRDGWKNAEGRPIENAELWKEFLARRQKIRVPFELKWQRGKTTTIAREVDKRAKSAAASPTRTDWGFRPGKVSRSQLGPSGASTLFPAHNQEAVIRVYRKALATKTEYKVFFEVFSDIEKRYSAKHFAYVSPEVGNEMHRSHCYTVQFNDNPKYPKIEKVEAFEKCQEIASTE